MVFKDRFKQGIECLSTSSIIGKGEVVMDNLFRDRFPLVFEGEKCPETFTISMDFISNGLDIVPSFEANPVFYVLSQFENLFHFLASMGCHMFLTVVLR